MIWLLWQLGALLCRDITLTLKSRTPPTIRRSAIKFTRTQSCHIWILRFSERRQRSRHLSTTPVLIIRTIGNILKSTCSSKWTSSSMIWISKSSRWRARSEKLVNTNCNSTHLRRKWQRQSRTIRTQLKSINRVTIKKNQKTTLRKNRVNTSKKLMIFAKKIKN